MRAIKLFLRSILRPPVALANALFIWVCGDGDETGLKVMPAADRDVVFLAGYQRGILQWYAALDRQEAHRLSYLVREAADSLKVVEAVE